MRAVNAPAFGAENQVIVAVLVAVEPDTVSVPTLRNRVNEQTHDAKPETKKIFITRAKVMVGCSG